MYCHDNFLLRYSTNEQGFPLCYNPTTTGASDCDNIDYDELILYPMLFYLLWQIIYAAVVINILLITCMTLTSTNIIQLDGMDYAKNNGNKEIPLAIVSRILAQLYV